MLFSLSCRHDDQTNKFSGSRKEPHPDIEIHPDDGENFGIRNGQWVYIRTRLGQVNAKVRIESDMLGDFSKKEKTPLSLKDI